MKAYIVDDDEVYKMGIKRLIKRADFINEVQFFENGKLAIDALLANKSDAGMLPNVILLDINMPIMDGWEFLEIFNTIKQQLAKSIIIYMVSSSINPKDIEKAKNYEDVTEYLEKPVTLDEIQQMVIANPHPRKNIS